MGKWVCLLALIGGGGGDDKNPAIDAQLRPWIEAWANGTSAFTTVGP